MTIRHALTAVRSETSRSPGRLPRRLSALAVVTGIGLLAAACSSSATPLATNGTNSPAGNPAGSGASSTTSAGSGATVEVATVASFGKILTNGAGLALYTFSGDHNGVSACTGSCAQAWPPLTVPSGTAPTGGSGVTGTLASAKQANGTLQVTYNGALLYTFASDSPGQVTGNGVEGFSVAKVSSSSSSGSGSGSTTTPTTSAQNSQY